MGAPIMQEYITRAVDRKVSVYPMMLLGLLFVARPRVGNLGAPLS
jgi:hypothetical protein